MKENTEVWCDGKFHSVTIYCFLPALFIRLTTFSRGAAPNTLNTGLGLEGEMHNTMACWPTLVVYSSNVARSFLLTNTILYFCVQIKSYKAQQQFYPRSWARDILVTVAAVRKAIRSTWADESAVSYGWKGWIQRYEAFFFSSQLLQQQQLPYPLALKERGGGGEILPKVKRDKVFSFSDLSF